MYISRNSYQIKANAENPCSFCIFWPPWVQKKQGVGVCDPIDSLENGKKAAPKSFRLIGAASTVINPFLLLSSRSPESQQIIRIIIENAISFVGHPIALLVSIQLLKESVHMISGCSKLPSLFKTNHGFQVSG